MHEQARNFTLFVKKILADFFINKHVLDVGSGDINGNNKFLFEDCTYEGNDVIQVPNVTIVSKTKDLPFQDETFDTIISTECFEHDPEYKESFLKIYKMLKSNGLFCFTCASTGRGEHGTRRTSPGCSYGTIGNLEDMMDYYKNLTELDLNEVLNLNSLFTVWDTYYNFSSHDLYFVGIKKSNEPKNYSLLEKYEDPFVLNTSENIDVSAVSSAVSSDGWVNIGIENENVTVPPNTRVRYGANGIFVESLKSGTFCANNDTFGDPINNVVKKIEAYLPNNQRGPAPWGNDGV